MLDKYLNRFFFVYSIIAFSLPQNNLTMFLIGIGLVSTSCILLLRSVKQENFPFLIFSIFILNYCIVPLSYLFGRSPHILEDITFSETKSTVYYAANCLLLFLTFFIVNTKFTVPSSFQNKKTYMTIFNPYGYYVCIVLAIFCIVFGVSGKNIFEMGGYGNEGSDRLSIYEYGIIFISLSLIYSVRNIQKKMVYIICVLFIIKDLIYGGRVSSVMLIWAIFILQFLNSFSFKKTLVAVICGYVFFQFWGYFRSGISGTGFDVTEVDENAKYVFYASMRIHYLIDNNILALHERLSSFLFFLLSTFLPSNLLPDLANLSQYKISEYYSGGGGLISSFVYCWGGIIGILLSAMFIGKSLSKLFHSKSIYWNFYAILILITTPRWFAYYPISIIKYAVYGVFIFFLINKLLSHRMDKQIKM